MRKVRVLVVDDAVVIRRIVSDILGEDPEIEVAGTAANGKIALAKIPQLNPDLITLDVEMPDMDGITTVREIRKLYPKLPVIMFSTLTALGAETALNALAAGANDYVTKPANVGSVMAAKAQVRDELIPKIKGLCNVQPAAPSPVSRGAVDRPIVRKAASGKIELVVIGVSTGGPNALAEVIPALPGDLPVPVLIVQHMPAVFTKVLADRLNQQSKLKVKEAEHGEEIRAGTVYLAPGDYHMQIEKTLTRRKVRLNRDTPENSCRPAADVLFRSAAEGDGANTLAVILTGMGQDGLRGSQMIRDAGGRVIAQDEATSVVWGMPGAVARAGLPEQLFPLKQVAGAIAQRVIARQNAA
jgi:two-component system chemotaxis response regulator CheB